MATGDSPAMQRMQEDAMRRAREAHRRSAYPTEEQTAPQPEPPATPAVPPQVSAPPPVSSQTGMLNMLLKDSDRTTVLLLLVMLQDTGNHELLFALLSLLL